LSTQQTGPGSPGVQLSPDGYYWWDGTRWVPVGQPVQPAQPAYLPYPATFGPPPPRRPVPWLRIIAGASAVVGVIATLVACIVPYGTFPDPNGGPTTTSSIFNGGFSGAGWDIAEPVFAILAGLAAAILVLVGINRLVEALAAGALIAVGAQTATMWAAYYGLAGTDGSPEAGGVIGVAGAVLMFVGGLLALAALFSARPATEAATPTPAAATTPTPVATPALPAATPPPPEPEPAPPEPAATEPASTETAPAGEPAP
jgi:hypothetical protein